MNDLLDDKDFQEKLAEAAKVLKKLELRHPHVGWTSRKLDSMARRAEVESRVRDMARDVQAAVARHRPAHGVEAYMPHSAYRLVVRELLTKYDITPKEK